MDTIKSFDDDQFELINFGERLEKFINVEQDFVEGSLVIALTAKYGSGKSTFLKMWSHAIENRQTPDNKPIIVTLNAWESDYFGDPLFAIISSMVNSIRHNQKSAYDLMEAVKDLSWFAISVGSQVSSKFTGVDPIVAGEFAEQKKSQRNLLTNAFSAYEDRRKSMDVLKTQIRLFIEKEKTSVLFLVDELDRCRPDYAIAYLETIKHIFDIKGINFVLAADREQLENSARQAFGINLDFDEYYRKFIHREIKLPIISTTGYGNITARYIDCYLRNEGSRFCYLKLDDARISNISELIEGLNLTPRQIQEVFRILGHLLETNEDMQGQLRWCWGVSVIAMCIFKVGAVQTYNKLGKEMLNPQEALSFLQSCVNSDHVDWWFIIFMTGNGIHQINHNLFDTMKSVQLIEGEEDGNFRGYLQNFHFGWHISYSDSPFRTIFKNIEEIVQWN